MCAMLVVQLMGDSDDTTTTTTHRWCSLKKAQTITDWWSSKAQHVCFLIEYDEETWPNHYVP